MLCQSSKLRASNALGKVYEERQQMVQTVLSATITHTTIHHRHTKVHERRHCLHLRAIAINAPFSLPVPILIRSPNLSCILPKS